MGDLATWSIQPLSRGRRRERYCSAPRFGPPASRHSWKWWLLRCFPRDFQIHEEKDGNEAAKSIEDPVHIQVSHCCVRRANRSMFPRTTGNIIKLHGITASPVADAFEGDGSGFFFTMDVMEETLTDRLRRWRSDEKHFKKRRGIRKMLCRNKKNAQILRMYSRLETSALGVAKAMSHIHEHRILHRDLKSSNIGFHSETGQVCLFDFGLAKKLDQCDNNEICGSVRYMAPEVMRGAYSYKSDVFSFGVLLFEIASLKRGCLPRRPLNDDHHASEIPGLPTSPFSFLPTSLKKIPCQQTRNLVEDCLSSDSAVRPSFQDISIALSGVLWPTTDEKHSSLKTLERWRDDSVSVTSVANTFETSGHFGLSYQDIISLM